MAVALIETVNLRDQTVGNLETGGIVLGTVNPKTGGQTLIGGVQGIGGVCHHAPGIQGRYIGINLKCHFIFLSKFILHFTVAEPLPRGFIVSLRLLQWTDFQNLQRKP